MSASTAQPGEVREDDDFTTALYRAAIGPMNTSFYLSVFTTWENSSRWMPRWNSAAGLWTLGWLAFRKMGGAALAYVGALVGSALLIFGIGRLFFDLSATGQTTMFLLWLLIAVLIPGLWGNVWFHSHCRKRMAIALADHPEVSDACAALARQSSQPRRALAVGTVQVGLLVALGLATFQFSTLMQHAGMQLAGASSTTPQMASGTVRDTPAAVASAPATPKVMTSVPAMAAKPPLPVAVLGRYGVNVGLFAKAANAQSAQAKLEAAQLPTQVDILKMQRGLRTRIRVGPFTTEAQAGEAAIKVRALGLEALTYRD